MSVVLDLVDLLSNWCGADQFAYRESLHAVVHVDLYRCVRISPVVSVSPAEVLVVSVAKEKVAACWGFADFVAVFLSPEVSNSGCFRFVFFSSLFSGCI